MLWGIVIDKAYFLRLIFKLIGLIFTISTVLWALRTSSTKSESNNLWTLSEVEIGTIKALLAGSNSTCAFNSTLNDILDI